MKFFRRLLSLILIVFVGVGIYACVNFFVNGSFFGESIGSKTVLVMGMDESGLRSDVMMVVFINGETGSVDVLSVPRDTRASVNGRKMKINAAHAIDGPSLAMETVNDLLGIQIDNYVKFSFDTFVRVIDALGGVDFYVPQDMKYTDPYQDLYIDLKEGQQHLDGDKAEQLVRFRQYPMGDEDRIKVQQEFLKALVEQKLNVSILARLPMLANEIGNCLETDIPSSQWLSYANVAKKMSVESINTYKLPGGAQRIGGASYYIADGAETDELIYEITQRQNEKSEKGLKIEFGKE